MSFPKPARKKKVKRKLTNAEAWKIVNDRTMAIAERSRYEHLLAQLKSIVAQIANTEWSWRK